MAQPTPFHTGEQAAQRLAGTTDSAASGGAFIRKAMPDQHRAFFADLPFLVVSGAGMDGRVWVSILEGPGGFVSSPDPARLTIGSRLPENDPLAAGLARGGPVGLLGIDLASRRRNRLNGTLTPTAQGYGLQVEQSFGNCPQYIHSRDWSRVTHSAAPAPRISGRLDAGQARRIAAADTLFIGSGLPGPDRATGAGGFDASHRGGAPGFVKVQDDGSLLIPDYSGNNFFNTLGNLLLNPRLGLLFVDFTTGGLLHVGGLARIDWNPQDSHDPAARRMIRVAVDSVVDRPGALSLRWRSADSWLRLKIVDKVPESAGITSFHLAPAKGSLPGGFEAGQHLPVRLNIPGHAAGVERSYSLSGSPAAPTWRISVKCETYGIASRFLHDRIGIGDEIDARPPQGDFTLPQGDRPLVLVSAGVGITPMLSMLHATISTRPSRPVRFVHVTRNGRDHAFAAELQHLLDQSDRATRQIHYTAPTERDNIAAFDRTGRVGAAELAALPSATGADFMLCGPTRFMAEVRAGLEEHGIHADRIHAETFGPAAPAVDGATSTAAP